MKSSATTPVHPSSQSTPTLAKRRIFLVDDHPITRQGVVVLINQESDLEVCGEADSAPKAFDLLQKSKADLAVVDISLAASS
jgi:DNA-binding NarL/FixJ family response regulator